MSTLQDTPVDSTKAIEPAPSFITIGRQAIMDGGQHVMGYELFNRSTQGAAHSASSDVVLLFATLSNAGGEDVAGNKTLFINCVYESLSGGHLDLVDPKKIVLELPALEDASYKKVDLHTPVLTELHARGFRLSFNQQILAPLYAAWLPLVSFIKLDISQLSSSETVALIQQAKKVPHVRLIAEKIETAKQYDLVSSYGVHLFQGYWFARPADVQTRLLAPTQAHIVQLINLVRKQASTAEIEEVLKKDAALAFNLLRLINSAGLGVGQEITSFRQAIMLLGLRRLFRWAALLLTASRLSGTPPAVGQTAVVRGRLMELLRQEAPQSSQDQADLAFVAGMFSLLDVMLQLPMETALEMISLPDEVRQALLHRKGPIGSLLTLAVACESSDDDGFTEAASALNLSSQQINWAHLQALAWPDDLA